MQYRHGGMIYSQEERAAKVQDLVQKAENSVKTSEAYSKIGYHGHSNMAVHQAKTLMRAAAKVMNGQPISDYENKAYDG